jgi:hypothetical protein
MRAPVRPENDPLYEYTLMPTHMRARFAVEELQDISLAEPFSFTKGCRTLRIPAHTDGWRSAHQFGTLLWDLHGDPAQEHPLTDEDVEQRMVGLLVESMAESDAPVEQFERLGLPLP